MTPLEKKTNLNIKSKNYSPNFFAIVPPRSGSTWLFENLKQHHEIYIPQVKEVKYFSNYFEMCNIDWYLNHFQLGKNKIKGDISPSYSILLDETIKKVKTLSPKLKIIFIFRDPIERAWSHAKHQFRLKESVFTHFDGYFESIPEKKFIECIINTWLIAYSDYLSIIKRWMLFYPKKNIYINFFSSTIENPKKILGEIFLHIGVSEKVDWSKFPLQKKINQGLEQQMPDFIKKFLLSFLCQRTRDFASFLTDEFSVKIPDNWKYILSYNDNDNINLSNIYFSNNNNQFVLKDILSRETIQCTHVELLEENYKNFKILAFKSNCIGIAKSLDGISIVDLEKNEFEKYKREFKILCSSTLSEMIKLIDSLDKDSKYKALQTTITEVNNIVVKQNSELEVKESRIIELQNCLAERNSIQEEQQSHSVEKDKIIRDQSRELETKENRIIELQNNLAERDIIEKELRSIPIKKNKIIREQNKELKAKESRITELQNNLAERDIIEKELQSIPINKNKIIRG